MTREDMPRLVRALLATRLYYYRPDARSRPPSDPPGSCSLSKEQTWDDCVSTCENNNPFAPGVPRHRGHVRRRAPPARVAQRSALQSSLICLPFSVRKIAPPFATGKRETGARLHAEGRGAASRGWARRIGALTLRAYGARGAQPRQAARPGVVDTVCSVGEPSHDCRGSPYGSKLAVVTDSCRVSVS
jgi:hypothetical protein